MADTPPPQGAGGAPADLRTLPWVRRVIVLALCFEAFLVVVDHFITFRDWIDDESIQKITNVAREESLPTWWSSTQAVFVGLTGFCICAVLRHARAPRKTLVGWAVLSAFFLFIGIDDAAVIHERVGSALGRAFEGDPADQPALLELTYSWQIFLGPLFAGMGVFLLVFLWRHLGRYGLRKYLLFGLGCFAVAMGIDFLEGVEGLFDQWARDLQVEDYTVSHNLKVLEESLEMIGTTSFWWAFLSYLARASDGLVLRFSAEESAEGRNPG